MNANQKIFVGCIAALILCLAVVAKHFFPDLDTGAIVALCVGTLTGLGVTHLNADAPAPDKTVTAPGGQGGFASIRLLMMIAAVMLGLVLAGCAGLNAQGVLTITYNTPAATTSATLVPGLQAVVPAAAASAAK